MQGPESQHKTENSKYGTEKVKDKKPNPKWQGGYLTTF